MSGGFPVLCALVLGCLCSKMFGIRYNNERSNLYIPQHHGVPTSYGPGYGLDVPTTHNDINIMSEFYYLHMYTSNTHLLKSASHIL